MNDLVTNRHPIEKDNHQYQTQLHQFDSLSGQHSSQNGIHNSGRPQNHPGLKQHPLRIHRSQAYNISNHRAKFHKRRSHIICVG